MKRRHSCSIGIDYFRSGWAFFLPYVLLYLVYGVFGWPVNDSSTAPALCVPCLLHVFWALHAIHAVFGLAMLVVWISNSCKATRITNLLLKSIPWLCLAVIIIANGPYLEWPADPWEHYRRIREWSDVSIIRDHSAWTKSSYFLLYSLGGHRDGETGLFALHFCYAALSLLLCWNYYRLARTCALDRAYATVFVVIQALALGNNVFSFYRYYGLSSTIIAQIGALAVVRMVIEFLRDEPAAFRRIGDWLVAICALIGAGSIIAANHPQGLAIAGLGAMSVVLVSFAIRSRLILWSCVLAATGANALAYALAYDSTTIRLLQTIGVLGPHLGFDLLDLRSLAGQRMLQIIGAFGIANFGAALFLIRTNPAIAAITLGPPVALLTPIFSVPFAAMIVASNGLGDAVMFHRTLFCVPPFLAILAAARHFSSQLVARRPTLTSSRENHFCSAPRAFHILRQTSLLMVSISILLHAGSPTASFRLWHILAIPARDLTPRFFTESSAPLIDDLSGKPTPSIYVSSQIGTAVRYIYRTDVVGTSSMRHLAASPASYLNSCMELLAFPDDGGTCPSTSNDGFRSVPDHFFLRATVDAGAWSIVHGDPLQSVELPQSEFPFIIQNTPGTETIALTSDSVPIWRNAKYTLRLVARQTGKLESRLHLAVAWYDAQGRLLESNRPRPTGAGEPLGWVNGTYSYFGLVGTAPPQAWAPFTISFGPGQAASVPRNACFLRAGILVNAGTQTTGTAQIADLRLKISASPSIIVVSPQATELITPYSQAAAISGHWPPNQISTDNAGAREIHEAAGFQNLSPILPSPEEDSGRSR